MVFVNQNDYMYTLLIYYDSPYKTARNISYSLGRSLDHTRIIRVSLKVIIRYS